MNIDYLINKLYRKKVIGIIFDTKREFLLVQLKDYKDNEWNFPGGGVEKGETEEEALFRELKEELGTDKFKIIKKGYTLTKYNWPLRVILKRCINNKGIWIGQKVKYFNVKFIGKHSEIKPDCNEIKKYKWIKRSQFEKYLVFRNQLDIIEYELGAEGEI